MLEESKREGGTEADTSVNIKHCARNLVLPDSKDEQYHHINTFSFDIEAISRHFSQTQLNKRKYKLSYAQQNENIDLAARFEEN